MTTLEVPLFYLGKTMQKIKITRDSENKYTLTELLDVKSLEALNRIFNTHYARPKELVKRDKTTNFFKKLMAQRTGVKI